MQDSELASRRQDRTAVITHDKQHLNMTSFVTEVLASSGKLEKEDLMTKISKLTRKSDDIKVCELSISCNG